MKCFILATILFFSSCSTLKRQKLLGGVIGSFALGGLASNIGRELSPNAESDRLNTSLGAGIGGTLGFFGGMRAANYLWQDGPRNNVSSRFSTFTDSNGKSKIMVVRPKDIKRIELDTKLPSFLKGKVKETNVITYELESYEEETEDGRKIIHEPHKAYEYVIE